MSAFMSAILMSLIPLFLLFTLIVSSIGVVRLTIEGLTSFKARQLLSSKLEQYQQFGKNLRKGVERRQFSNRRLVENDRREEVFA